MALPSYLTKGLTMSEKDNLEEVNLELVGDARVTLVLFVSIPPVIRRQRFIMGLAKM